MSPTSPPATLTHPDLEELAAFLDGTLPEKDRARVVEHLADCEDCFEIFAGAARFQEDSRAEEEEEKQQKQQEQQEEQEQEQEQEQEKDSIVPLVPKQRSPIRQWLPLAAAALLAVAVGIPLYREYMTPPDMEVGELAAPYQRNADAASAKLWLGTQYRGGATQNSDTVRDSFQLGVQVMNLHLGLVTGKPETASDSVIPQIYDLLDGESFIGMASYQARYQKLRGQIEEGRPVQGLLEQAAELDADLEEALEVEKPYIDFGKWTTAARLAAVTKNHDFFERRDNRRFPGWFLRNERESLEPEVADTIDKIQQILEEDPIDYDTLQKNLETILATYDD